MTTSDQGEKLPSRRTMLLQHAGLLLSGTLMVLCALRIMLFAKNDLSLALAILSVGNQFTILTSTLFAILPVAALLALYFGISWTVQDEGSVSSSISQKRFVILAGLFMPFGIFFVPVILIGIGILLLLIYTLAAGIRHLLARRSSGNRSEHEERLTARMRTIVGIWAVGTLSLFVVGLIATPWVPSEKITIKQSGKERTIYGYVIGQQGKQSMIIDLLVTQALWIDEDDLGQRTICTTPSPFNEWYWRPMTYVTERTVTTSQHIACEYDHTVNHL